MARRPSSVCPSVCKHFAQIAYTRQMTGSRPNLHTMVSRRTCIQDVPKVKVEVKGHVIPAHLEFLENHFFSQANGCILTKLSLSLTSPSLCPFGFLPHPNPQMAVSLHCEFRNNSHGETVCQTVCYTLWRSVVTCAHSMKHHYTLLPD